MKKLLVTGASGFLGWHVCNLTRSQWQVYGTYWQRPVTLPGVAMVKVDLGDRAALQTLFDEVQPDAVLHLAALSKPKDCQADAELSYRINVRSSRHLAELAATRQLPCAFTSSDLVFDGRQPPYDEDSPVNPLSIYGEHKVLAEQAMLAAHPGVTVCRMPLMFGPAAPQALSFVQAFAQTLRAGEPLRLFTDEYRLPVSAATATQGLLLALAKGSGLLHLGGRERRSRYEFGLLMAEVLDLPTATLHPCRQEDVVLPVPRPADLTLDSRKAFALGYDPPSSRDELVALRGQV
ncbi:MAG: SDR family oxidoreductase [Spirulinaceae cyanobacterium SM2_1_0]|nr:SDR family oxidoreductase [Spirulinaceae cyanobacterium SM2_1_0]